MVAPVRVENDQSVKIPRAVAAAAARSDEIHKQAYQTGDPPANGNEPPPAPPADAAPAPSGDSAPPPAPPAPVPPATAEDWKGRYDSLKGRFDTQQGQLQNQAARISSLESMIATMSKPPAETTTTAQPTPASKRVKPEEIEEYGADFVDVVQRAALDIVQPLIEDAVAKTKAELKTDIGKVGTKVAATERETAVSAHQRLLDTLDKQMTNWRVINKHPKFLNWLNLTDPLSGVIRRNLLNDAVSQGNAARALSFYRAFIAEEGDPAPATPQPTPAPGHTNGAGNGSGNGLEKYAAPGRPAASGSAPAGTVPPDKEIITRAQISAFYSRKAQGHYSAQEAADLEAQIFAAQKEGRIR